MLDAEAKQVLTRARSLIADPERWTIMRLARDRFGVGVSPFDPSAHQFCARGAVSKVIGVPVITPLWERVDRMLNKAAGILYPDFRPYGSSDVAAVNNALGHEATLAVFDALLSGDIVIEEEELPFLRGIAGMRRSPVESFVESLFMLQPADADATLLRIGIRPPDRYTLTIPDLPVRSDVPPDRYFFSKRVEVRAPLVDVEGAPLLDECLWIRCDRDGETRGGKLGFGGFLDGLEPPDGAPVLAGFDLVAREHVAEHPEVRIDLVDTSEYGPDLWRRRLLSRDCPLHLRLREAEEETLLNLVVGETRVHEDAAARGAAGARASEVALPVPAREHELRAAQCAARKPSDQRCRRRRLNAGPSWRPRSQTATDRRLRPGLLLGSHEALPRRRTDDLALVDLLT